MKSKTKSKRAWIAVTEAVTGIVLLFVFVMLAIGQIQKEAPRPFDFNALFIQEIDNNVTLRNQILAGKEPEVNASLNTFLSRFNQNYDLYVCISEMTKGCPSDIQNKEITAIDYFVAATEDSNKFEPKRLRIFLWRKE